MNPTRKTKLAAYASNGWEKSQTGPRAPIDFDFPLAVDTEGRAILFLQFPSGWPKSLSARKSRGFRAVSQIADRPLNGGLRVVKPLTQRGLRSRLRKISSQ